MEQLCREIGLAREAADAVCRLHADPDFCPHTEKLCRPETWQEGLAELKQALGEDPRGYRMLCSQLRCALEARRTYERLGLSREIYVETMKAFSRFVGEHIESYGFCAFDRGFWTVRQISCRLFRIGQLEYELTEQDGVPVIGLHIPSDADLTLPGLRQSYLQAREILNRTFPAWAGAPVCCESWLLSQDLPGLLPESSRILAFQRSFSITPQEQESVDVLQWVFQNPDLAPEELPQKTSLQRSLRAFLLAGGTFHNGEGVLMDEPFV